MNNIKINKTVYIYITKTSCCDYTQNTDDINIAALIYNFAKNNNKIHFINIYGENENIIFAMWCMQRVVSPICLKIRLPNIL